MDRTDYDRPGVAETFRAVRGLSDLALAHWRDVLRALVPPASVRRIADVGCGAGRFSAWLTEVFDADVIGLEPSRRMLAAAPAAPRVRYVAAAGEAIPLVSGCIDVAFLSLVYHHLADPARVVRELWRVLPVGGRVIVRTPTLEILDCYEFLRFFPEARTLDARRMPTRAALRETFATAGFAGTAHRTVEQVVADSPSDYCARVRARSLSSLMQIRDDAFARGVAELEAHCLTFKPDRMFREPVDVFVFERRSTL